MYQANHEIDDNPQQNEAGNSNEFKFDVDGTLLREHAPPGGKTWQEGSLGKRLRKTRESQRLNVQDVCDRLYLERFIIEGLEADDYSRLPPRTFVQGYIRGYAKLLNAPVEPLLQCFYEQAGGNDSSQLSYNPPKDIPEAEATSKDPWFKLFSLFLLVAVLVGFGLWWSDNDFQLPQLPQFTPSGNANSNDTKPVTPPPNPSGSLLPADPESLASEVPPAMSQAVLDSADYQPPGETDEEGEQPEDFASANTPSAAAKPPVETVPATASSAPATSSVETAASAAAPAVTQPAIVLTANSDCWTEITDANGKKLVTGMIKAGESREFNGTAPFKLKLGRPQAVSLVYQGKAVDLSGYANSIARLTLQ